MSYKPTARAGSLRAQHHGGHGFGQVTISSTPAQQLDIDGAISQLAQPTTSGAPASGTKSGIPSASITPQKDINASFAASTQPGWFQASQVPMSQSSNAPVYLAIGGAVVLFGIIMLAMRSPKRAPSTANGRRRRRRRS